MSKFSLLMSVKKKFFPEENRLKRQQFDRKPFLLTQRQQRDDSILQEIDLQNEKRSSRLETDAQNRKRAKQALVLASSSIKKKEFRLGKSALAYAVDCLNCISEFDLEVRELLEACYEQATYIHKNNCDKLEQKNTEAQGGSHFGNRRVKKPNITLNFNKELGQFEFTQQDRKDSTHDVALAVSRLNKVLFAFNNRQTAYSMGMKLNVYRIVLLFTFLILLLTLFILFAEQIIFETETMATNLTVMLVSSCFLIPLVMIYFRSPEQEIHNFFQNQLKKQIDQINQNSEKDNLKVKFELEANNQLKISYLNVPPNSLLPGPSKFNNTGDTLAVYPS